MSYDLWQNELDRPTPEARRGDRPTDPAQMSGFWRTIGARTLWDTPIAIWEQEGTIWFKMGRAEPVTVAPDGESPDSWRKFIDKGWLNTVAATQEQWQQAVDTGYWSDGKAARKISPEEKVGLDDTVPTTPASEGGNMPPEEDAPTTADQIKVKIEVALDGLKALGAVTDQEKANKAAEIAERLRTLWNLGDERRAQEKKPHDDAAKAVQNLWLPIITPAESGRKAALDAIKKWQRDEADRQRREREAEAEKERQRIQKETEERLKAEAEATAKQAAAMGLEHEAPTEDEIAAQAQQHAAETVAPVVVEKPRVSSAHGKAVSTRKTKVGRVTDETAFVGNLLEIHDEELRTFLADKANRLARSGTALRGMLVEVIEK